MKLPSYIAGEAVDTGDELEVFYPWDNSLTGTVAKVGPAQLEKAVAAATHTIFIGRVIATTEVPNIPLLYTQRHYGQPIGRTL